MPVERRGARRPAVLAVLTAALATAVPAAAAGFSDQGTATGTFATAPDWVAPQAGTTVIAKAAGYLAGRIKQGGTYYVYANVTDSGDPPSGVATETADTSLITTGATGSALTAGSYSVAGETYSYRSAALVANGSLNEGGTTYSIASTDAAGNNRTQTGFTVTVDNTPPSASDVQTANQSGGVVGEAEAGDTITFTYSEQIDPESVLAGWTGGSTNVSVRLVDGGCILIVGCAPDLVRVFNDANSSQLPLGEVALPNGGYNGALLGTATTAVFISSTMVQSGSVITITLGNLTAGSPDRGGSGTTTWVPSTTAYDAAGNPALGTAANESGGSDREF